MTLWPLQTRVKCNSAVNKTPRRSSAECRQHWRLFSVRLPLFYCLTHSAVGYYIRRRCHLLLLRLINSCDSALHSSILDDGHRVLTVSSVTVSFRLSRLSHRIDSPHPSDLRNLYCYPRWQTAAILNFVFWAIIYRRQSTFLHQIWYRDYTRRMAIANGTCV